jgi:hypothetical protein
MSYGYYSLNNINTGNGSGGSDLTITAQTPLLVQQTLTTANIRLFESPLNTINFNTYNKSLNTKDLTVNGTLVAPSGAFTSLRATSMTGGTAYFDTYLNLPTDPFNVPSTRVLFSQGSGATGSPNFTFANNTLSIQSITGSSAHINSVNVQSLTGTTCYFDTYLNLPNDPVIPLGEIYFSNGSGLTGSNNFTYAPLQNNLGFNAGGLIDGVNQIFFDQDGFNLQSETGALNVNWSFESMGSIITIPLMKFENTVTTAYTDIVPYANNSISLGATGTSYVRGFIKDVISTNVISTNVSATGIQCVGITGTNASFDYINFSSREYLLYTQNFGASYTWNANTNLPFNVPLNSNANWSSTGSFYVVPRTGFYNIMAQLQVLFLPKLATAGRASIMLNNTTPLTNHYLITTDLTISMSIIYPFVIGDTISIRHTSTPSVTLSTVSNDCLINITEL